MPTSFLEIVELPDGRIILRRAEDEEVLVTLDFSADAKAFLQGHHVEVAKAMLNVGVHLVSSAREIPTWVMASPDAPATNAAILESQGVRVLRPKDLADGLVSLRREGIESLLCEGGGALGAKLLVDGLVDRLYWVQAPIWLGEAGVPAFPGVPAQPLPEAPRWIPVARQALGPDTLLVLDRRLCLPVS